MIQLQHVCKTYGEGERAHHALRNVNLTIDDGDVFGIIGASGAGKSTLVRCLQPARAIPPRAPSSTTAAISRACPGEALLELRSAGGHDLPELQPVPAAHRACATSPSRSSCAARRERPPARRAPRSCSSWWAWPTWPQRYPSQLSGGQQQRVAIARALANNPKVMLCDEATSALDPRTTASILQLLQDINRDLGVTLVVITHSLPVANRRCNRVAVIDQGRIVEEGVTAKVFSDSAKPRHARAAFPTTACWWKRSRKNVEAGEAK